MNKFSFFDGHNDTLLRMLIEFGEGSANQFIEGNSTTDLDLPRALDAGFAGGFFAIFAPSPEQHDFADYQSENGYKVPMPPALPIEKAQHSTRQMAELLKQIELHSDGKFTICKTASDLKKTVDANGIAAIMHIEGADCIDPEFRMLDELYALGLRSLGPVWSRNNIFGNGVPFHFPSSPDIGDGLTELGKQLVERCNHMQIMLDLSHLNEKGFWDVQDMSNAPLVATHSNAHQLCASPRNLTDRQLKAIADSGGVVGVNYAPCFFSPKGLLDASAPIEFLFEQFEYLVNQVGVDGVALGSDIDGVVMPETIGDITGVPTLFERLAKRGFKDTQIEKIALGNWIRALETTIG